MAVTPHSELVIALQYHCLVAIRNCLISPSPARVKEASAIAEASHAVSGCIQIGNLPFLRGLLDELELAITTPGGIRQPGVFNAIVALRDASGTK